MNFLREWQAVLRWMVTLAAFGFIALHVDLRALATHIAQAEIHWIALSSTLSIGVVVLMGLRWKCVLRACDLRVPLGQTVSVTFIGQFFNAFLPGSTGGDVVKAWYATKWAPERKAAPVVSVLYDRLTAIVTLLVVTTIVLGTQAAGDANLRWLFERFVFLALLAFLSGILFVGIARLSGRQLLQKFACNHPVQRFCERHFRSCRFAPDRLRHFCAALGVSVPAHLLNVTAAWCVARAVHLETGFLPMAVAVAFVNFSSVLPVSVGGHGVREAGFVFIFTLYGVLPGVAANGAILESVLAFSFLFFARSLISSLPGAFCYAVFRRDRAAAPQIAATSQSLAVR